jgi:hypothetical protein
MPRVNSKTKNKAGQPYSCVRCSDTIKAGEKYYEWSFRYGGTRRQHQSHGMPKPSQLTQSKMSSAYAAIEAAEDAIAGAASVEDLASALNDCASEIENVSQEYQDGLDSLPDGLRDAGGPGGETQEKIDALNEFAESLQSTASDLESEEPPTEVEEVPEGETPLTLEETQDEWLDEKKSQASDALGELSI